MCHCVIQGACFGMESKREGGVMVVVVIEGPISSSGLYRQLARCICETHDSTSAAVVAKGTQQEVSKLDKMRKKPR